MSIETYEAMLDENEPDREIALADAEYRSDGELLDAKETHKNLRRKHFENRLEARLEVRLQPEKLQMLKDEAAKKNTSVGGIVREAIDSYCAVTAEEKLEAVRKLAKLKAPATTWDKMKKEVEAEHKPDR